MAVEWEDWSTQELLDLRMSDLEVRLQGSWVEPLVERVCEELEARGLCFRPHFWLADEWFSPDGVPGVAVPFYLAHKKLMALERRMMFEVEGGNKAECLMLLRHELGHAVDHAYRLSRRRLWRETFGSPSQPYPEYYRPNPRSHRFVQHLDGWYAQAHPFEDFAETFAVWLTPRNNWRRQYKGWPALKKLEAIDRMLKSVAETPPPVRSRAKPYSLGKLRHTLRTHYDRKRAHYHLEAPSLHDRDLRRLFVDADEGPRRLSAATFLRQHRKEIRERVARWTGEYEFTLDQILKEMIQRCRDLDLRLKGPASQVKVDFAIMLAVHTVQTLHRGVEWHPM
ncbi:MAG: putative zinc-binding metallopeptidase [Polyangiaceae bacterium]